MFRPRLGSVSVGYERFYSNVSFSSQGLPISDFARSKLDLTGKELLEEREEALAVCKY